MFESLGILPPALGPSTVRCSGVKIRVAIEQRFALPTPLVAYDLPWYRMSIDKARRTFDFLDGVGISVAGLAADFAESDSESESESLPPPTICPYRPERYGLSHRDLAKAKWIDIRLVHRRDAIGLATYSTREMERWHRRGRISSRIPAMGWPPEVSSRAKFTAKVNQLRTLAPKSIVSVSIDAIQVMDNLDLIQNSPVDVLGLVARDWPVNEASSLVRLICRVGDSLAKINHALSAEHDRPPIKLMIVPPPIVDVSDVVKLFGLGASLVAVDGWCRELVGEQKNRLNSADWAELNLGVQSKDLEDAEMASDFAPFENRLELFRASLNAIGITDIAELNREKLISFSQAASNLRDASEV